MTHRLLRRFLMEPIRSYHRSALRSQPKAEVPKNEPIKEPQIEAEMELLEQELSWKRRIVAGYFGVAVGYGWLGGYFDARKEVLNFREWRKIEDRYAKFNNFQSLSSPYRDTDRVEQPEITTEEQAWNHGKHRHIIERIKNSLVWPFDLVETLRAAGIPWAYEVVKRTLPSKESVEREQPEELKE